MENKKKLSERELKILELESQIRELEEARVEELFTLENARKHIVQFVPEGNELIVKWNKVGDMDLEGEEIITMYKDKDGLLVIDTFHIDALWEHEWDNLDYNAVQEMVFSKENLEEMLSILQ